MLSKLTGVFICLLFFGCAGTIKTYQYPKTEITPYKLAYIFASENSQFIRFKFGVITPFAYMRLPDDAAVKHEVIGNTDAVIKQELEKYGMLATIGKNGDESLGFDLIVEYYDTWRWDFKKILDKLEIVFITPDGKDVIAKSILKFIKTRNTIIFLLLKKKFLK